MSGLLTPAEAAAILGVCIKVLHRLRRDGHIRYIAVTDRKFMFRVEDCEDYIESRARRDEPCPSTERRSRRTGNMISSGKVVAFTALPAARQSATRSGTKPS